MNHMRSIEAARVRVVKAESYMEAQLKKHFPLGMVVRCWLQAGQTRPSEGEVIAHPGGRWGLLRVRLLTRMRKVRDVPAKKAWRPAQR